MTVWFHEWSVGFPPTWKASCVKNRDRWTYELAVLQGQIVIALLLSHATVSKRSALSLFHHILHINKIAREWSEGDKERKRREGEGRRGKRERDTNWSFGGEISHSHPGRMDECLWWPLQVRAGRVSENKRNWFGPSGGESMCEGQCKRCGVVLCRAMGVVQSLKGLGCDSWIVFRVHVLFASFQRKKFQSWKMKTFSVRFQINRMSNCRFTALRHSNHISQSCYR